jgi:sugar/nucleoside kinase (ribokinase family)
MIAFPRCSSNRYLSGSFLNTMYDICCIGHITSDKVVTHGSTMHMPGGTAYYFSKALGHIDTRYILVTSLADTEMHYVEELRKEGIEVTVKHSRHTVYFENIYGDDPDQRTQNVLETADPFTKMQVRNIQANIFHLGPLLAGDIPVEMIKTLATNGKVSLDVQGYLRKVVDHKVHPTNWPDAQEALQYVDIVKADETELQALTGIEDPHKGAMLLAEWGVQEVVITNGSKGSFIYSGGNFYTIPAYRPRTVADATGCGDTYMAGYLYQRVKSAGIQQAGEFAAAMASLKMESPGPFTGTEEDVIRVLESQQ